MPGTTDPHDLTRCVQAALLDARPFVLVFGPMDDPVIGGLVEEFLVGVSAMYGSLGGQAIECRRRYDERHSLMVVEISYVDSPPPDTLFRWGWRERAGVWVRRVLRRVKR